MILTAYHQLKKKTIEENILQLTLWKLEIQIPL